MRNRVRFLRALYAAAVRRQCLLLVLLAIAATGPRCSPQSMPQPATPVREADAVCGKCHAQILKSYLATPMAMASGPATEGLRPRVYRHAASGVEYQVALEDGTAWMSYRLPGNPSMQGKEKLEYFLGSGHLGLTYLYAKNSYWFESPIAYYSSLDGYAMKPGLGSVTEMPPALTINSSCLRCHMSDVQPQERGTENRYQGLPFLHVGITCESCHGDARAHLASGGRVSMVNPIKLAPERRDSICIVCHLEGDTNVERRGRSITAFRPGDDIRDYLSYFAFADANTTKRAVSEIEQFNSSRCKLATGAAMSCMSCHDPHRSPAPSDRVSFYRERCLVCHTDDKYKQSHYTRNPDCTSCHMPRTGAENIAHVAWTDHRIRQHPSESSDESPKVSLTPLESSGGSTHGRDLAPILGTEDRPRDLALAYYNLVVKGVVSERQRASEMVAAALRSDPGDEALLRAMGVLAEGNGNLELARSCYLSLLSKDPVNLTARTNLGTILAKSGDLEGAVRLWSQVFESNEDLPQLGANLAIAECRLGYGKAAANALDKMFFYSPDLREMRRRFEAFSQTTCKPATVDQMK